MPVSTFELNEHISILRPDALTIASYCSTYFSFQLRICVFISQVNVVRVILYPLLTHLLQNKYTITLTIKINIDRDD